MTDKSKLDEWRHMATTPHCVVCNRALLYCDEHEQARPLQEALHQACDHIEKLEAKLSKVSQTAAVWYCEMAKRLKSAEAVCIAVECAFSGPRGEFIHQEDEFPEIRELGYAYEIWRALKGEK